MNCESVRILSTLSKVRRKGGGEIIEVQIFVIQGEPFEALLRFV